jgi:hypothetical protein
MRILITGGAGFIGSNLALRLKAQSRDVTLLDSLAPQIHGADPANTSPLFASVRGEVRIVHSICDEAAVAASLEGQEAAVHQAAETGTGQSLYQALRRRERRRDGVAAAPARVPSRRHPASVPTSPRSGDCSASRDKPSMPAPPVGGLGAGPGSRARPLRSQHPRAGREGGEAGWRLTTVPEVIESFASACSA